LAPALNSYRPTVGPVAANFACFSAMAMWSFVFPVSQILLETWGAVSLTLIRQFFAVSTLLMLWFILEGWTVLKSAKWLKGMWVGGYGFGLGAVLLVVGQKMSDAVTPAIVVAMMPIIGTIIEILLDGRRLKAHLVVGILFALSGGLIATGVDLSGGEFGEGAMFCLVAVILFALGTRSTTREFANLSSLGQTTITLTGAMLFLTVTFLFWKLTGLKGAEIGNSDQYHLGMLIGVAILSLAFAQFLWIKGAGVLGIMLASFHMNAVPFYVMVIVVLFLDQDWNASQAIGALLVAIGVIVSQWFGDSARSS
jgi:drug/metabolite transporter (DMT)-like permease